MPPLARGVKPVGAALVAAPGDAKGRPLSPPLRAAFKAVTECADSVSEKVKRMTIIKPVHPQSENERPQPYPVLQWVMCHPGVLMFSTIAVGTMLASRCEAKHQSVAERRVETEADIIDGDVPLFV